MLAASDTISAVSEEETLICQWTSDGEKELIGFLASGTWSAEYRLYVSTDPIPWYAYLTSPMNRTAYVADRGSQIPQGLTVKLYVYHEADQGHATQQFRGTILGG